MTDEERFRKLDTAARLVSEVSASLDKRQAKCATCDIKHYVNVEEFRASESLDGVVNKIARAAGTFYAKAHPAREERR